MSINDEHMPLQRLLAFDTSTSSLAVAVMENGRLLAERNIHAERNHSAYLVTAIGDCLKAAGLGKADLTGIAVGIGPGSYTGIRIAVTTAKTLAWTMGLPVFGVSSLAALALGGWANETKQNANELGGTAYTRGISLTREPDVSASATAIGDWIVPLVDARRGQAYTALFETDVSGGLPKRLEPDGIRLMVDWTDALTSSLQSIASADRPSAIWFIGETSKHEEVLENMRALFGNKIHIIPYELEGVWMGLAGTERSLHGKEDEVHSLEPNYTQLAEAEAKRLRNG